MRSIAESDLGTPKSKSTETVALTIDGVDVRVPAGTSVLRAASEAGITIPKLCATELLDAFGSCRLCLVEIEGMRGYPASCTTPVAAGMKVKTQSEKLGQLRRGVMELYLSDHPLAAIEQPPGGRTEIAFPDGYTTLALVRKGKAAMNAGETAGEADLAIFDRAGDRFAVEAEEDAALLVLGGTPIDEPVVSYGPFVMNTEAEIRQAVQDYRSGRMGRLAS